MMKYDKEQTVYEGYFFNVVIYFAAMFVGSFGAVLGRTLVSFVIRTPSLAELKADSAYLFDRVYPLEAVFTTLGFLALGFFACYFAGYKIGGKTGKLTDTFKIKLQLAPPAVIVSGISIAVGIGESFIGVFGMQFWYSAAALTRLFGGVKNTDMLGAAATSDLTQNSFVPQSLAFEFLPLTLIIAVIECSAFAVASYYGRRIGEKRGVSAREAYLKEVRGDRG